MKKLSEASILFEQGQSYESTGQYGENYKKAFEFYKKAALLGHPAAMNMLGFYYERGLIGKPRKKLAIRFYEDAARLGDMLGIYNLGVCYFEGNCIKRDFKKAHLLFKKSANLGHVDSIIYLSHIYECGLGVKKNISVARKILFKLLKSDKSGDVQCRFGEVLLASNQKEKAIEVFKKSAAKGNGRSKLYLGMFYFDGIGVPRSYEKGLSLIKSGIDDLE